MKKKKAFVLPIVVISMLFLSLVSLLIFTMVVTSKNSSNLLLSRSNKKLALEKIYFDFKNDDLQTYDDFNVDVYLQDGENLLQGQSYSNSSNQNETAVSCQKENEVFPQTKLNKIQEVESFSNETTFKAIIISKGEKIYLFSILEFENVSGQLVFRRTVCYQTNDFLFEFGTDGEGNLNKNIITFGDLTFNLNQSQN